MHSLDNDDPRRKARFWLFAAIATAALGMTPLWLYSLFGPKNGNPIGLGLIMVATTPIVWFCGLRALYLWAKSLLAPRGSDARFR